MAGDNLAGSYSGLNIPAKFLSFTKVWMTVFK